MSHPFNKITNWYFSRKALPYWIILVVDCAIIYFSTIFTYWAFFRGSVLSENWHPLMRTTTLFVLINIVSFRIFHTYSGILRFSSFVDLKKIGEAMLSSGAVIVALHFWTNTDTSGFFTPLQTSQIVIVIGISIILMWGMRLIVKIMYDDSRSDNAVNVLIYGAQDGGVGLAKSIRNEKPMKFYLKGFISHDSSLKYTYLLGQRVFEVNDKFPDVLKTEKIGAVLVAPKRNQLFRQDTILQDYIINAGVKIYMGKDPEEWDKDSLYASSTSLSEVKIEDLLPRQQISVDLDSVRKELEGKKIMITGSAGSIGSEIVRQVAAFHPAELILVDQAETPQHDIRLMMARDFPDVNAHTIISSIDSIGRMRVIFERYKPDFVFHAAAYKHVPMMEDNPSASIHNNVRGTKNIADLSVEFGVSKFVMISTDKAVNPTNVMGCSKRICEIYVQSLNKAEHDGSVKGSTQFVTTRFGNVLGSNGSVIPIFQKQIADGGPVTVTDPNIVRYFMLIPEACKLVLEAGVKGEGGEIFVFDMGKPVKIADLARRMIRLSGAKNVNIKFTGLRDGEKLYEEVLNDAETTKPSFHEKIRIASVREYEYGTVEKEIEELIDIANDYDPMKIVAKMKQIVPEYKSNHSVYSVLDN